MSVRNASQKNNVGHIKNIYEIFVNRLNISYTVDPTQSFLESCNKDTWLINNYPETFLLLSLNMNTTKTFPLNCSKRGKTKTSAIPKETTVRLLTPFPKNLLSNFSENSVRKCLVGITPIKFLSINSNHRTLYHID